jgi:hypothetical protein
MIGSDATPGSGINRVHPRTMGTFPRVPGKCVRKDGVRREIGGVMCSILIRSGLVVDGSGTEGFRADVAVDYGRIAEVGLLPDADAATVIDAAGLVVSPGFIDMHSHADFSLPLCPTAESLVHQGITSRPTAWSQRSSLGMRWARRRRSWIR